MVPRKKKKINKKENPDVCEKKKAAQGKFKFRTFITTQLNRLMSKKIIYNS